MDIERVYQTVRMRGPLQPNDIKKILGGDTVIIGAMLSDLAAQSRVRITALKLGSSPFYYTAEQASRLQELSRHLGEKDRRAFDLLRQEVLLQDGRLDPLTRVALRSLKDFAKPLEVTVDGAPSLFWKWYLASAEEAQQLLQRRFAPPPAASAQAESAAPGAPAAAAPPRPDPKPHKAVQETLVARAPRPAPRPVLAQDAASPFADRVRRYFEKQDIHLLEHEAPKRGSDLGYVVSVPSAVGPVTFACRALAKKKVSEADVTAAYAWGTHRHLPVILLVAGVLTKKAQDQLVVYKGVTVKRL